MKISISAQTFDLDNYILLDVWEGASEYQNMSRRVNKTATLDTGVVIQDNGWSHGDRVFTFQAEVTQAQWTTLYNLNKNFSVLTLTTPDGAYQGSLSELENVHGTVTITFMVESSLSDYTPATTTTTSTTSTTTETSSCSSSCSTTTGTTETSTTCSTSTQTSSCTSTSSHTTICSTTCTCTTTSCTTTQTSSCSSSSTGTTGTTETSTTCSSSTQTSSCSTVSSESTESTVSSTSTSTTTETTTVSTVSSHSTSSSTSTALTTSCSSSCSTVSSESTQSSSCSTVSTVSSQSTQTSSCSSSSTESTVTSETSTTCSSSTQTTTCSTTSTETTQSSSCSTVSSGSTLSTVSSTCSSSCSTVSSESTISSISTNTQTTTCSSTASTLSTQSTTSSTKSTVSSTSSSTITCNYNDYFATIQEWEEYAATGGASISLSGGAIKVNIPDGTDCLIRARYRYILSSGDFDLRIDIAEYSPEDANHGAVHSLRIIDNQALQNFALIRYYLENGAYKIHTSFRVDGVDDSGAAGAHTASKLRIVRDGTTFKCYYYDAGTWNLDRSKDFGAHAQKPAEIRLFAEDNPWNGGPWGGFLRWDNLVFYGGCPEGSTTWTSTSTSTTSNTTTSTTPPPPE